MAQWVLLEPQELMEHQEHPAGLVHQGQLVLWEPQDSRDPTDELEARDSQEVREVLEILVNPD